MNAETRRTVVGTASESERGVGGTTSTAPPVRGVGQRYNRENARIIYGALKAAGINFIAYLPDSWSYQLNKLAREDPDVQSISVSREDEGMAICMGAFMGGRKPAIIMEASGWGLSGLVLSRPGLLQRMPLLILSSHVISLGEIHDYHGETRWVEPIVRALGLPYMIATDIQTVPRLIRELQATVEGQLLPAAIMFPRHILWEEES